MSPGEEKRIQIHVPYKMLLARFGDILAERINPEVYMDAADFVDARVDDLKMIRREFDAADLRITMHGPYVKCNPGSAKEPVRLHTVEVYKRAFEAAAHLRPVNIVLHAGYKEGKFSGGADQWLEQSMKTWPRFVSEAADIGMTIAAENIFETEPSTLKTLVETIASPSFRVCLDSGHLGVYSGVPFEEWFKALAPYLAEAHLHDNNSEGDEHLPVGEGTIDFPLFFKLLEEYAHDPVYTIEPHGEEAMRRAIKAVRKYV